MNHGNRPIDHHETRSHLKKFKPTSKVKKWREAWSACYRVVEEYSYMDLKQFHKIFERWVPILNIIFENTIPKLDKYDPTFFYCNQANGPKEIIKLYMDENIVNGRITTYIIFNIYEFNIIHKQYCTEYAKSNQMNYNEARGTVNLTSLMESDQHNPAEYFKLMSCWYLLFIYTLHALAHWDTYDKYDHGYYDTHSYVRDSPFFKFHFYGQIVYRT